MVLAVSHEQFLVFPSNAAILGLRACTSCSPTCTTASNADRSGDHPRFVGVKMIIAQWPLHYHMPTYISLPVIGVILAVSIIASLKSTQATPDPDVH